MKKILLGAVLILSTTGVFSQIYTSKTSDVSFESKTPVEDIYAQTKTAKAAIVVKTKAVKVKIKMISFKFEKPLMEEHFNEKYVETEKYPDASFDGVIQEDVDFTKDGTYNVNVKGKLNLHGVIQERTLTGTIKITNGVIELKTDFKINLVDHEIKVPSVVTSKIAETIDVKAIFVCEEYKKK